MVKPSMEEAALRAHMGWEAFIVEEVAAFMVAVAAASMVAAAAVAIENTTPIVGAERHKSPSPSGVLL